MYNISECPENASKHDRFRTCTFGFVDHFGSKMLKIIFLQVYFVFFRKNLSFLENFIQATVVNVFQTLFFLRKTGRTRNINSINNSYRYI